MPVYGQVGGALSTSFGKLWSIFKAAIADPSAKNAICKFDALDECNDDEQHLLTEGLEDTCIISEASPASSHAKFLITSRPYFAIKRQFNHLLRAATNIELAGTHESEKIEGEISCVIKHRVAEIAKQSELSEKVQIHLERRLLETEQRTYLWLRLMWEIIKLTLVGTVTEMDEVIDDLPEDICDSYEKLLRKSPRPRFTIKVLQIVLAAFRPLTLKEMDVALHMNKQTSSYADLELEGPSRLESTLPSRCGLMVTVVHSKVYFVHQSVKEFLLDTVSRRPASESTGRKFLTFEESHQFMLKICLRSMTFVEVHLDEVEPYNALVPKPAQREPSKYCQDFDLMSYAALYWADHHHSIKREDEDDVGIIENFLAIGREQNTWNGRFQGYGTALHAASAGGYDKIVRRLIKNGVNVEAQAGLYSTGLIAASSHGHETIVQLLLDEGANINAQGGSYGTALIVASKEGHEKLVRLLIEKRADINLKAQIGEFGTALIAALYMAHGKLVQLLLKEGADVNLSAQAGFFGTALIAAVCMSHESVVQLLLDNGADIDMKAFTGGDSTGRALTEAISSHNPKTVKQLLDAGANVNLESGVGTPLEVAQRKRNKEIVRLLLA